MAYSLPDLVLVGAAQNLVLEGSVLEQKLTDVLCLISGMDRDLNPVHTYDHESTW